MCMVLPMLKSLSQIVVSLFFTPKSLDLAASSFLKYFSLFSMLCFQKMIELFSFSGFDSPSSLNRGEYGDPSFKFSSFCGPFLLSLGKSGFLVFSVGSLY